VADESTSLFELLEDELKDKEVWDYHVWAPMSLDDSATLKVVIQYGTHGPVSRKEIIFDIVRRK
jgi:hypothetical protein